MTTSDTTGPSTENTIKYSVGTTGMITSISLTGAGGGYSSGAGGYAPGGGGTGGITNITYTNGTSSGTMNGINTISMPNTGTYPSTVSLGSGVYSISTGASPYSINPYNTNFDSDITISRPTGRINVGKTLEMILEHLNLIVPVQAELDSNPSLKLAYENYLEVLAAARNQTVKDAFDSYQMIRKLSKDDND